MLVLCVRSCGPACNVSAGTSLPFVILILYLLEALISLSYLTSPPPSAQITCQSRVFQSSFKLSKYLGEEVSLIFRSSRCPNHENPDSRPRIIEQMIDRMSLKRILFGGAGLGVWEGRNEVLPTASMEAGMRWFYA